MATSSTLIGVRRDKEVIIAPTVDVLTGQAKHLQEYKSYKKKTSVCWCSAWGKSSSILGLKNYVRIINHSVF